MMECKICLFYVNKEMSESHGVKLNHIYALVKFFIKQVKHLHNIPLIFLVP